MIKLEQGILLSAVVDKLDLKIPEGSDEKAKADFMMQIVTKAHKAKDEIYEFVSVYKRCSVDEAKDVNLIELIKEIMANTGVSNFLSSAAESRIQE